MKKIIIFIVIIIISTNCLAEINQIIDNYTTFKTKTGYSPYPVTGRFEFINLPAPLEETTIHFTLEFVNNENVFAYSESQLNMDWEIKIICGNIMFKLLSDSLFTWPGPHKIGDIFTGGIRCVSLASGSNGFKVEINRNGKTAIPVHWKLDENGKLMHLDKSKPKSTHYPDYLQTYFFKEDSVYFKAKYSSSRLFKHEITIKPVPQIGDTSVMHIRLRANKDIINGMDQSIRTNNVEIVSFPYKINQSIIKDQITDLILKFIPLPVNATSGFAFQLFNDMNDRKNRDRYTFYLVMIFNNDGTLQFVNDNTFSNEKKYIPTKFKEKKQKGHIYEISKDKDSKVKQIK